MNIENIVAGLHQVDLGGVNVFLIEIDDGLVLIDTGNQGQSEDIVTAIESIGKSPSDLRHILVTHMHPDHMGGLAELKRITDAKIYAHPLDAPIIRDGAHFDPAQDLPRPFFPAPGMEENFARFLSSAFTLVGAPVDQEINEGDVLPFLPDLDILFVPGHCAGQIAFLLKRHGGILFAADCCSNVFGLGWSLGYEDLEEGKRSLKKLCKSDFQMAVFGHGAPIKKDADIVWREAWGQLSV